MRRTLTLLVFCFFAATTRAAFPFSFWSNAVSGPPPTPYTLLYDSFFFTSNADAVGHNSVVHYIGLSGFQETTSRILGKVTWKITKTTGSISAISYRCRVWSLSGTALNTALATSDAVLGDNGWSQTSVDFIFSTPYTLASGTTYAITLDAGGIDASNYISVFFESRGSVPSPAPGPAGRGLWRTDKTRFDNTSSSIHQVKIYSTP